MDMLGQGDVVHGAIDCERAASPLAEIHRDRGDVQHDRLSGHLLPGGIGREPDYVCLDPMIGDANAAIVVVAIRVIQTLVEIVLAGLGMIILQTEATRRNG